MRFTPKVMIVIVAIIALSITAATVVAYYRSSLIHFNGSINKDYLAAFGSFIGGTVGIILSAASFILIYYTYQYQQIQLTETRKLVNRQIALSIRPDLVVNDFYMSDEIDHDTKNDQEFDGILPPQLQYIQLEILNVGVEVARYIEYRLEYNITDLISYLNTHSSNQEIKVDHALNSIFGKVQRVETGEEIHVNMFSDTQIRKKDHLMPFKLSKDKLFISLPYFYSVSYYYSLLGKFKSNNSPKIDLSLDDFPRCLLKVNYLDLEAKKYDKTFDIKTDITKFSSDPKSSQTKLTITAIEMYQNPF